MRETIYEDIKEIWRRPEPEYKQLVDITFKDGSVLTVFDPDGVIKTE